MTQNHIHPKISTLSSMFIFWMTLFFVLTNQGFTEDFSKKNAFEKTTQARLAVEHAWETYHHAALGGTLASPSIQTQLETNLHKSRALLAEAYDAEDKNDNKKLKRLVDQIKEITDRVETESREPKK